MSSNGEISVAVKAEGVDDAAAEMGEAGDGGGGGGSSTLSDALKGGIIGGLLSQALGPLLDVLDPILKILQAFLAPVAALLMRLLAPVLRLLLPLLPAWIDFVDDLPGLVDSAVSFIQSLPGRIWEFVSNLPSMTWDFMTQLPGMIWDFMKQLPQMIWDFMKQIPGQISDAIIDAIPGLSSGGGPDPGPSPTIPDNRFEPRNPSRFTVNEGGGVDVNISTDQQDWITATTRNQNNSTSG